MARSFEQLLKDAFKEAQDAAINCDLSKVDGTVRSGDAWVVVKDKRFIRCCSKLRLEYLAESKIRKIPSEIASKNAVKMYGKDGIFGVECFRNVQDREIFILPMLEDATRAFAKKLRSRGIVVECHSRAT